MPASAAICAIGSGVAAWAMSMSLGTGVLRFDSLWGILAVGARRAKTIFDYTWKDSPRHPSAIGSFYSGAFFRVPSGRQSRLSVWFGIAGMERRMQRYTSGGEAFYEAWAYNLCSDSRLGACNGTKWSVGADLQSSRSTK